MEDSMSFSHNEPETISFPPLGQNKDELISTVPSAEVIYSNDTVIIPTTVVLSGCSLSDSNEIVEVGGTQIPPSREQLGEDATDASLLQNFGNQTADSLIIETTSKRKASIESIMNPETKRSKLDGTSATNSEDSFDEDDDSLNNFSEEGESNYMQNWSAYLPIVEPLPLAITLPFLRAFANKKFEEPIPLFIPPTLPVGQPHHWPALFSLPPLLALPTMLPLYPQSYSYYPSYFGYQQNDIGYSQESDEEEGDEDGTPTDTPTAPNGSLISPLTTLASLASGTVKD